ncbi:terpenoid synthase [Athelia psychrophila]|uniref:Terpenoid synthase n=1 Tax=Athelia psychrophila TaxID=1759441 RepID=A0A166IZT9_9AGAM|nr:terpenoid synthase [Fibularhizoctonia sp. CBS 109695]
MSRLGYIAPFPPLSDQPFPPARNHSKWKEIYRSHDEWVSEHWPYPNEQKRSRLPATKLAGLTTWAAPFTPYDRVIWAARMTGIFILVDDLLNSHNRDPCLVAGFQSVVDGNGPLHATNEAEIAYDLVFQAVKHDCHPQTYAQLVRLTKEWWDANADPGPAATFSDLDHYLLDRGVGTGVFMINAVLRYAADINLADSTINHPLVRRCERIAAEYGILAQDLQASAYEKAPPSPISQDILSILSTQYQLTAPQARALLQNKMAERERDFISAGQEVYADPELGKDPQVRRWIACLPYGMGGYLAWCHETTRFNIGNIDIEPSIPFALEVVPFDDPSETLECSYLIHFFALVVMELIRVRFKYAYP